VCSARHPEMIDFSPQGFLNTRMLLKKYFWTIHFTLLAVLGWLLGGMCAEWAASRLTLSLDSFRSAAVLPFEVKPALPGIDAYSVIARHNVFSPGTPSESLSLLPAHPGVPAPKGDVSMQEPSVTDLKLVLHGTVVAEDPVYSFAVIREEIQGGKQKLLQEGNQIQGATIKAIRWREVLLERAGKEEVLIMASHLQRSSDKQQTPVPPSLPSSGPARRTGSDTFVVDRAEAQNMISNINEFMTELRIRPYFVNGAPAGYLVSDIRQGSVIESLGIRNGDIIKSVNGMPITRPEQAFAAYQQLQEESELTLELQRGPHTTVHTYQLK